MNEAWHKHIQPLLEPQQGDNHALVGDSFLGRYSKLTGTQKIEVEDALVRCAFDPSNDVMAGKALALASALQASQRATGGLARLMCGELRNRLPTLDVNRPITRELVSACGVFGLTEAVPSIRALAASVGQSLTSGGADDAQALARSLLRACIFSLRRLGDDQAQGFVSILVDHDLGRAALTTPELERLSPESIVGSRDRLGPSVLRAVVGFFRRLEARQRSAAAQLLEQAARAVDFPSDRERREVMDLIGGLRSAEAAAPTPGPEERMRGIRHKRSSENALTGLVLSVTSLVLLVALLVLGWNFGLPTRTTIYALIGILVTLVFGLASAASTLYEARASDTTRGAPVLAAITLAVCALVIVGLGILAFLILS